MDLCTSDRHARACRQKYLFLTLQNDPILVMGAEQEENGNANMFA